MNLRDSKRLVIAGASSLLGAELKSLLEESLLADWEFRLVDEEAASGTLTEAGGEAAVIQPVEEDSFDKSRFVFFTGSQQFTRTNLAFASRSGATVVDLSGASAGNAASTGWLPKREAPSVPKSSLFFIPSAAGEGITRLALALRGLDSAGLTAVCFQPVSEAGKSGVEELESQTGQLLSFQSVGKPVFDAQVAFNLLDRFGAQSLHRLSNAANRIRREVSGCIGGNEPVALQLLHAPVFYGTVFAAFAKLPAAVTSEALVGACKGLDFATCSAEDAPSNVSAAGETAIQLAPPQPDASVTGGWWFWGAADNIRLPAWNAVKLAEKLLG